MPDPVWLPEVLRNAGLTVNEYPGWRDRGHGDFGSIWGVVAHHTGSYGASARGIAEHPELGLCSQLHLSAEGVYTICGAGVAWHAGMGSYPGLPTNNANQCTIGIEAANDGRSGWSDAQYDAYVRGVAAILDHLGHDSSHVIGHKEWAAASQGKWDPGGIDMDDFRRDVQAHIDGKDTGMAFLDEEFTNWAGHKVKVRDVLFHVDLYNGLILDQLIGPGARERKGDPTRWESLGNRTVVEALAALLEERGIEPLPTKTEGGK
jgi:hypothetical protein